jgi:dethiobiotin synthetase
VVLVAGTGLGTINHTLLALEALRSRSIKVVGVVFVGEDTPDTQQTIADFGAVKILGRVPMLDVLDGKTLKQVFEQSFTSTDFEAFL